MFDIVLNDNIARLMHVVYGLETISMMIMTMAMMIMMMIAMVIEIMIMMAISSASVRQGDAWKGLKCLAPLN